MSSPRFFENAAQFRAWLETHHDSVTELVVGFHRVQSGRPTMTWTEAVREALCFGWIDGVVKRLDDERYTRRFTPRTARSTWSAVNVRHAQELLAEGRMQAAGIAAFESRTEEKTGIYSHEQRTVDLPEPFRGILRANKRAVAFWDSQPASYRKAVSWWVVSAKQDATRHRRVQSLVEYSARGERIPQFVSSPRTSSSITTKRGKSA